MVAAAACLAGCMSADTKYMELIVPDERFKEIDTLDMNSMAAGEGQKEAAVPSTASELTITLEECRAAALTNNLGLKAILVNPSIAAQVVTEEEAQYEAMLFSNATLTKAEGPSGLTADTQETTADLGVSLPLRTGGTLTLEVPVARIDADGVDAVYDADARVSLSQQLLRGAGLKTNTYAIRVAMYESQITRARTKLEVIRVIAEIDRIYWRLYTARRQLEVKKNEYDLAVAQLERARRRVHAGAASEVEVTRAESGVADRTEAIIVAENAVRLQERLLKRAINRADLPVGSTIAIVPGTEPHPMRYTFDSTRLMGAATAGRMEMLELELQIAEDASTIDFTRNGMLPLLALDYAYDAGGVGGTVGDAFEEARDAQFEGHTLGVSLQVPLGNAAARSRLQRAILSRIQRLATRDARENQIREEVLDAIDVIEAGWQRVLANRQRTVLSDRTLAAEIRQFDLGLRTSTDVLNAQTNLANAQSAEISALADYEIAQTDLAFATGTLLGAAKVRWEAIDAPK
jgi:outer membrane protein TolC